MRREAFCSAGMLAIVCRHEEEIEIFVLRKAFVFVIGFKVSGQVLIKRVSFWDGVSYGSLEYGLGVKIVWWKVCVG